MARTKYIVTYNALKSFFQRHETEVAEIEVLPPALSTDGMLEDGLCLGIPKQDLIVAFLHARTLFFSRNTEAEVCYSVSVIFQRSSTFSLCFSRIDSQA